VGRGFSHDMKRRPKGASAPEVCAPGIPTRTAQAFVLSILSEAKDLSLNQRHSTPRRDKPFLATFERQLRR
jgi:hypothetical protein